MRASILFPLLLVVPLFAADLGPDLLTAARKGKTAEVQALLNQGAPLESTDKEGRTPLMLAAEHDHPDTVRLLLVKGARADARDAQGLTAFGLAFLNPAKHQDEVLHLLPKPARVRLSIEATWAGDNVYSSCFMTPQQLHERLRETSPDALLTAAIREVAAAANQAFVELVAGGGDAVLSLRVRPGAMCVQQQSSDNLRMEVDARVLATASQSAALEKTFGGGLKGLKARSATSAAQYPALFEEFAKAQAGPIYWAAVAALLKAAP